MCKVYTGYHGTSETEHGLCACMVDNPLAKAWGLSLRTCAQTMLYLHTEKKNKKPIYSVHPELTYDQPCRSISAESYLSPAT